MGLVTPDYGLVFWMLITFGIVLFILKKFAWKPILQALKDRENSIQEALDAADRTKNEMAQLKSDNEKVIAEAKIERDNLLKDARELKDKIISEAKNQASIEATKMIEDAKMMIENEKISAINEIKTQVALLSIQIAEKILQKQLSNDSSQEEYVGKLVNDMKLN